MSNDKLYYEYMNEINAEELYEGLLSYGLFSEKLPPMFTSKYFFEYCKANKPSFCNKEKEYIYYESMRNTNIPRLLGIPNPMKYQQLCLCLSNNWLKLQEYFKQQTQNQNHKISRIHLRKMKFSSVLFEMNYKDWRTDSDPESNLLIGAKYVVHADISNCFPSIYTHALPWALIGKGEAKANRGKDEWYNELDKKVRNLKNGETHGLIIGPHASNLLAEIILVNIDNKLHDKYKYIRNIDDYTCYVPTYEDGQLFLHDLAKELREFDLFLNHKKTSVQELPKATVEQWVRKINLFTSFEQKEKINYKEIRAYLDMAVDLMEENNRNSAIINYIIKVISKKGLTTNAKSYYTKFIFHLVIIYPYLVSILDEYILTRFQVDQEEIQIMSNCLYLQSIKAGNYEAVSYAIYFAVKYDFVLVDFNPQEILSSRNCIAMTLAYLYCKYKGLERDVKKCVSQAKILKKTEMDLFWLFVYEVLPLNEFNGDWEKMKRQNVSFIKNICK